MVQFHAYDMQPFGCCFINPHMHIAIPVTDLTRLNDQELDDFEAEQDAERDEEDEEEGSSN